MLNETSDADEIEMLKEEAATLKPQIPQFEDELKLLLIPKDPNDDKDVIVEVRAAAGGDEAAIFLLETCLECIQNTRKPIALKLK